MGFAALRILSFAALIVLSARESRAETLWPQYLHLLPAAGLNTSLLDSRIEARKAGLGTSLRADVTYFFKNETAVEICTSVNFNRVNELLIWDTLFALGFRARVPFIHSSEKSTTYFRIFGGRGPTVAVFEGERPPAYRDVGAQRIQFQGPVGGIGIGAFRKASSGRIWFFEALLTVHTFDTSEVIKSDKDVPVIVSRLPEDDGEHLTNLHVTVGVVAF